jgi:hypothetical protein
MSTSTTSVRKFLGIWSARAIAIALISVLSGGCSAMSQNATCALVGAGVGGAAGVIGEASTSNHNAGDVAAVGAIGAVVGAGIGYGICLITGD